MICGVETVVKSDMPLKRAETALYGVMPSNPYPDIGYGVRTNPRRNPLNTNDLHHAESVTCCLATVCVYWYIVTPCYYIAEHVY